MIATFVDTNFITPLIIIIASVVEYVLQKRQIKQLREELVCIKNTSDLREAVMKDLEGTWSLSGKFAKFQGDESRHNSEGILVLTWVPSKNQYDVVYCYSVTKAGHDIALITAICHGCSYGDSHSRSLTKLSIKLSVISRTITFDAPNYNRTFEIELKIKRIPGFNQVREMSAHFSTPQTKGILTFLMR